AGVFDTKAERPPTAGDGFGPDARRAYLPLAHRAVAKVDVGRQLAHLDRRERVGQVASDLVLQRGARCAGAPDRDLRIGTEERREEEQALDVVQVKVAEQDVDIGAGGGQVRRQLANAGARVEDQLRAVGGRDVHARGVASIAHRLRTGAGERAARAADLQSHQLTPSQKIASAPLWPPRPTTGNAVTSISCALPSAASMRIGACAGRASLTAIDSGSCSSASGSPLRSCGVKRPPQSWGAMGPASSKRIPSSSPAGSLKNSRLPALSTRKAGVSRFEISPRASTSSTGCCSGATPELEVKAVPQPACALTAAPPCFRVCGLPEPCFASRPFTRAPFPR